MANGLKVIMADDHPLFRGAMRAALTGLDPNAEIIECGDFDAARKALNDHPDADIVLLDLSMPGVSGLSGLVTVRAVSPNIPVAIVSATEDAATIRRALNLGASGYVSKSSTMEQIRKSISAILDGEISVPAHINLDADDDPEIRDLINRLKSLTRQQTRVLGMLSQGLLNKQIAYELDVSEATVKAHVSAILQKLGVESRTRAVIRLSKITNMEDQQKTAQRG
ncbi:MAG: response regulator transcription factor [Rhizobiaceae bacterium]|nr:response regulator transcription factor [Rhizobiaceae bacterium]